jgi:hypothetical protein
MKFIIHDLPPEDVSPAAFSGTDDLILPAVGPKAPCIGCFGCWLKTPGKCVLKDRLNDMGKNLALCDELVIVTKCVYGLFSPDTKNVIDRSISYLLPFFRNVRRMQHHVPRYRQQFPLRVLVYNAPALSQEERERFKRYVEAVSINLNVSDCSVSFLNDPGEVCA